MCGCWGLNIWWPSILYYFFTLFHCPTFPTPHHKIRDKIHPEGNSCARVCSKYQQHKHGNRIINNRVINNGIIKYNYTFTNVQWISLRKNIGKIFSKQNKLPIVLRSNLFCWLNISIPTVYHPESLWSGSCSKPSDVDMFIFTCVCPGAALSRAREFTTKPGVCPSTDADGPSGKCDLCDWDIDCSGWQKCCKTSHGSQCVNPTASEYWFTTIICWYIIYNTVLINPGIFFWWTPSYVFLAFSNPTGNQLEFLFLEKYHFNMPFLD